MSDFASTLRRGLEAINLPKDRPEELSPEEEKDIQTILDTVEPELEKLAKDLLREEIKDKLRRNPDHVQKLKKQIAKGKKLALKRKVGCIYLQAGDGSPTDPIEEVLVAST